MSGPDRIFIARTPGETRVALVAGERLLEVVHLRDAEAQPGSVYAGRVGERLTGSTDVFVDIGLNAAGVLETKGQKFTAGQLIAVEVATPARAEKGAKLRLSAVPVPDSTTSASLIQSARHPALDWRHQYRDSLVEIVVEPASQRQSYARLLEGVALATEASNDLTWAELEEQLDDALQADVPLRSGGRIRIEPTSALVSIDIDAGSSPIDVANTEAISAIAHHMRLRNLAGHIVVDLIPTKGKQRFVEALRAACAGDTIDTRIMGLTPSGMIDIVRQRSRPSLAETLSNAETTGYRALRLACRELVARRAAKIQIKVSPAVASVLNEQLAAALREARDTAKGDIFVVAEPGFAPDRIELGA